MIKHLSRLCCIFLLSFTSYSQSLDRAVRLSHDNDLYFLTDKYYSAGNHLALSTRLTSTKEKYTSLAITFGQNIFTPAKKSKLDTTRFDRPFAGWLFLNTRFTQASENQIWTGQLELGLTGPQSLADKVQRNYHRLINVELPSWFLQISNRFHADLIGSYRKGFWDNSFFSKFSASLGTKTTFVEQEVGLFWGSHSAYHENSIAGLARHQDKEWFVSLSTAYQYVFFNSLIEGPQWNNDAPFTTPVIHNKILVNLTAFHRWNVNSIEFSFNFNTKETPKASSHAYAGITYSRYF